MNRAAKFAPNDSRWVIAAGGVLVALIEVADLSIITDCPLVIQCTDLISLGRFNHRRH
jgi:hypothetical protein